MKKYGLLLGISGIALVAAAGLVFLFIHFGTNDARAISGFSAAYQNYDRAFSSYSESLFTSGTAGAGDSEQQADQALAELKRAASARISSLTRHDAEIMQATAEISDLAASELNTLKEYKIAIGDQSPDMDRLAKNLADATREREAAYARFLELTGQKKEIYPLFFINRIVMDE